MRFAPLRLEHLDLFFFVVDNVSLAGHRLLLVSYVWEVGCQEHCVDTVGENAAEG